MSAENTIDPAITLQDYITGHWLPTLRKRVEFNTASSYEADARLHLPADLKAQPVQSIRRGQLKHLLAEMGETQDLAPASVAKVAKVIHSIFTSAVDDEVITSNPADKLGHALGLRSFQVENIKAMDAGQLQAFLTVARDREPAHFVELAVLAFTGIRLGEMRGLQPEDVDLAGRTLMIKRQVRENGSVIGPKGKRGKRKTRAVDLADDLAYTLEMLLLGRREYEAQTGHRSTWLLYPDFSDQPTLGQVSTVTHRLRRAMRRVLERAKLPDYFTPHSLRHTFATLLLQKGEDILYVARQLGDTLAITAEVYGKWARVPSRAGGPNLLARRRVATPP